jgi:hypothetical protein
MTLEVWDKPESIRLLQHAGTRVHGMEAARTHTVARLLPGMPEGEDGRPLERKCQERRQAQEEANRLWAKLEAERSKGFWRRLFGR